MNYNNHIKISQKFQFFDFFPLKFLFSHVFFCAYCAYINKFFFAVYYDKEVLKNKILDLWDYFFMYEKFIFLSKVIFVKKYPLIFGKIIVAHQQCNKIVSKFFLEFFINVSTPKFFFILAVPSQTNIQTLKVLAEITRRYGGDL